jgi:dUTP pyrophosphatase
MKRAAATMAAGSVRMGAVTVELADERAAIPTRAHAGDVGYDLSSCETCTIAPGARRLVDTGIKLHVHTPRALRALGLAYHPEIKGRSGLASKHSVDVAAGQVDLGYRGRIYVCLVNHGSEPFAVRPGDRIAQLKFSVVGFPDLSAGSVDIGEEEDSDDESLAVATGDAGEGDVRGERGFGSTGR